MGKTYKIRLEERKRKANRLGKAYYHSTNKGEVNRLPYAKVLLDDIERNNNFTQGG
ncbi:hypothetical protein LCGC14_1315700 [marine sediment metagenome]|uniref:Uncharacterized protein n=1 Tax=marine sediment metagenome TaxID=412755 RepID=A0A0F9KLK8_9ZZZZ